MITLANDLGIPRYPLRDVIDGEAAVGAYVGVSVAPVRGGVSVFKSWSF